MQSKTGFPSSHQLKSYVASKFRLKFAAGCPVSSCWPSCIYLQQQQPLRYNVIGKYDVGVCCTIHGAAYENIPVYIISIQKA